MSSLSVPSLLNIAPSFAVVPAWLGVMFEVSTKAAATVGERLAELLTEQLATVTESAAVLRELSTAMVQALPTAFTGPKAAEQLFTQAADAANSALSQLADQVSTSPGVFGR